MGNIFTYPTDNNRIGFYDAVKGFAIFIMVIGHAMSWISSTTQGEPSCKEHIWFNVIYSFHMYLLFFLSGLFFPKGEGFSLKQASFFLKKKVQTLLIPFFTGGVLYHYFRGTDYLVLWFLRSLFIFSVANIVWEVIRCMFTRKFVLYDIFYYALVFVVISKGPYIFWGGHSLHYVLFCLGVMARRYRMEEHIYKKCVYNVSLIVFAVYNIISISNILNIALPYTMQLIPAISGTVVAMTIFKKVITNGHLYEYLKTLGFFSLEIYIAHGFFVCKIPQIGEFITSINCSGDLLMTQSAIELFVSTFISIIVITMVMLFVRVVEESTILKFVLFGKR